MCLRTLRLRHKDVEFETRYTAAGALWHAAMQPEAASTIVRLQGAPSLIYLSKSENHPATETFVPCLTLCALLNNSAPDWYLHLSFSTHTYLYISLSRVYLSSLFSNNICIPFYSVNQLVETGTLQAISSWVRAQNVLSFQSPFVWTTLKPLVSLLESKFSEVNELGCFMTVAEVCNKSEISKMFTEGVVSQLERFALANNVDVGSFDPKKGEDEEEAGQLEDGRRCTKLNSYMASIALSRLQIDVTQLRKRTSSSSSSLSGSSPSIPSPSSSSSGFSSFSSSSALMSVLPLEDTSKPTLTKWLKSLGLGEEVEEVLLRNHVNFDNIVYLEEDRDLDQRLHLPLGSLRKLSNAIKSLRIHRNICISSPPSTTSGSISSSASFSTPCLICMDAMKEVCFVPCGHVAVCETCSQIVRARKDHCLICRTPIETFVKLYFV
jgi:hypothetical protein